MTAALTPRDPWETYWARGRWRRVAVHPVRFQIACATDWSVKATAVAVEAGALATAVTIVPPPSCVTTTPTLMVDGGGPVFLDCGATPFGLDHF